MTFLLINTAGPQAVVMLVRDGQILAREEWTADRGLKKVLLEVIAALMERCRVTPEDINRIAVHEGPGHFGALRAGATVASGLAFAWKKDLVPLAGDNEGEMITGLSRAAPVTAIKLRYS